MPSENPIAHSLDVVDPEDIELPTRNELVAEGHEALIVWEYDPADPELWGMDHGPYFLAKRLR